MTSTVAATSPVETGLREDVLTLPDALAQSVTVLAPALSGGFITYLAAVKAGGATPLSFALATVVCLLIGGVVSGFARTIRSAGSLYTYTIHGLDTLKPGQHVDVKAVADDGRTVNFTTRARVDNETEIGYLRHGGILPLVLRDLIAKT